MAASYIRRADQKISLTMEQTMEMARLMKRPTGVRRFIHYIDINTARMLATIPVMEQFKKECKLLETPKGQFTETELETTDGMVDENQKELIKWTMMKI